MALALCQASCSGGVEREAMSVRETGGVERGGRVVEKREAHCPVKMDLRYYCE